MANQETGNTEIKPALSADAWRMFLEARDEDGPPLPFPGSLGVAAVSLHEHPQGFTWRDVDMLNDMAAGMELDISFPDGMSEERAALAADSLRQRAADLRNLAARHAALLAPRI